MNKVEAALQKTTGVKPGRDRGAYLDKLVEAVSNLAPEDWNKLSPKAQDWFNENIKLYNKEQPIPDFSDSEEADVAEAEAEEAEEAAPAKKKKAKPSPKQPSHEKEQNMAKTTAKKKAASSAKKTAKPAKSKPVRAAANGGEGARPLIIRMLIRNPKMSTSELVEKLQAKGSKASELSVSAMKSQYKQMLGLLIEHGLVKASLLPGKAT